MKAFSCGKPPLPQSSAKNSSTSKIKSTFSCGFDSSADEERGGKATSRLQQLHDSFSYDSIALTRDLFRGFILRRKGSLTKQEHNFLESLVEDGEEDDLNNAMKVLQDKDLFFHPSTWKLKVTASNILGCASSLDDLEENVEDSSKPASSWDKNTVNDVEVFESNLGAVVVEDSTSNSPNKNVDLNNITPIQKSHHRAQSEPLSDKKLRIGTPHRQARVRERRQSQVHSSLWKAHKQGFSLTPVSSFQYNKDGYNSIEIKRQTSSKLRQRQESTSPQAHHNSFRKNGDLTPISRRFDLNKGSTSGASSTSVLSLDIADSIHADGGIMSANDSSISFPSIRKSDSFGDSQSSFVSNKLSSTSVIGDDSNHLMDNSKRKEIENQRKSNNSATTSSHNLNSENSRNDCDTNSVTESVTSKESFRFGHPMRPARNPSPIPRPKLVKRGFSDGALPPRRDPRLLPSKNLDFGNTSVRTSLTKPKIMQRSGSIASQIDVLETIVSQEDSINLSDGLPKDGLDSLAPPTMIRKASEGSDCGWGLEVADLDNSYVVESMSRLEDVEKLTEDCFSYSNRTAHIGEQWKIRHCASEDVTANRRNMEQLQSLMDNNDDDEDYPYDITTERYDTWNALTESEIANEFTLNFTILGTSADDIASMPHVLSPPLMESLNDFLPYSVSDQNFYMKYSMIRDGASLISLLQNTRGSTHTIIALETTEGEVFGSFTSSPWRRTDGGFYGSGEAFLWRMKNSRKTLCTSALDQARLENDIEVFSWTGSNYLTQLCDEDKIALGGGSIANSDHDGFGLLIESDILNGESNPCATFNNPSLCHSDAPGSGFEIVNLEVWTLTPTLTVEEADKMEMARLFLEANIRNQ